MKPLIKSLAGLGCALFLTAGDQADPPESVITNVDLILTNGRVVTVDSAFSIHDTVVVDEGLIVETGTTALLGKYQADSLIDLEGKTLMPGLVDSHTHISGRPHRYIELSEVTSILEMQNLIRAKIAEIGEGEWITAYVYPCRGPQRSRQHAGADSGRHYVQHARSGRRRYRAGSGGTGHRHHS